MDDPSQTIFTLTYGYITLANSASVLSKIQKGNYNIAPEIAYNLTWLLGIGVLTEIDPLGDRPVNFRTAAAFSAGTYEILSSIKTMYENNKLINRKNQIKKVPHAIRPLERELQTKSEL